VTLEVRQSHLQRPPDISMGVMYGLVPLLTRTSGSGTTQDQSRSYFTSAGHHQGICRGAPVRRERQTLRRLACRGHLALAQAAEQQFQGKCSGRYLVEAPC